jgi:hypothetical protein
VSLPSVREEPPKPENASVSEYKPPTILTPVIADRTHEVCLEQYKAFLSDLGNIGSRYATLQGFYVSVISALLGLLALSETNKVLAPIQTGSLIVVCLFSIALGVVWSATIDFYRRLFRAKFTILRALESNLAYNCFAEEYRLLEPEPFLTKIERFVPWVLILFFLAIVVLRLRHH